MTETRDPGPFSGVVAAYAIPVDVEVGPEREVRVTCDENLLEDLVTRVDGGDLIVEGARDGARWIQIDPQGPCEVAVVAPELDRVEVSGAGDLTVLGPSTVREAVDSGSGSIAIDETGAAEVTLRATGSGAISVEGGATGRLELHVSGSGPVRARGLEAARVDASLSGSGDGEVTATEALDAALSGSGDLTVWGDPETREVLESGSGRVEYR